MSPVFGHGRLRLYLLKLLEESPRHGYEVIRLLQDRFLGVYSPSPGTIYPRLARLEEEGLVTHEVIEGKKVFSITDKGREELNARLDELDDLEQEISASVRDIAREVKEDVRDTVKSLRDELTRMAKDVRTGARDDAKARAEELKRLKEQQKRQWMAHANQWQVESDRLAGEWRRIWSDIWTTLGGDTVRRTELDSELGELLADFVAQARTQAADAALTTQKLHELHTVLDETSARIRDILQR
ncbi:helix-turn-helix transcriptional regulator [Nonomuraea sp. NPDC049684]|uniref:helix-turn-helix transcriptional regulator n=1 Tax=unclassified Nonomuraea TaxID=2593643 RepID=UPI0037B2764F